MRGTGRSRVVRGATSESMRHDNAEKIACQEGYHIGNIRPAEASGMQRAQTGCGKVRENRKAKSPTLKTRGLGTQSRSRTSRPGHPSKPGVMGHPDSFPGLRPGHPPGLSWSPDNPGEPPHGVFGGGPGGGFAGFGPHIYSPPPGGPGSGSGSGCGCGEK
jgi:hypothetical protein